MPVSTKTAMGTLVTIEVVGSGEGADELGAAMDCAFGWFHEIEERCTRFNPRSELMQVCSCSGVPVPVSTILYEAVRFALMLAEESGGAFDLTVGHRMEKRGFNREHRTGDIVLSPITPDDDVSFRDIALNPDRKTITLRRPLTLDLGAVAKGLAIDLAARELAPFQNFAIDAGGDLYLGGSNAHGTPWHVGIRHPRSDGQTIASLRVSNQAVCTSGDYERRSPDGQHHILDPRTGENPDDIASVTVIASGAMLADGLATAVFVLGPVHGIQLLSRLAVEGLIVTSDLRRYVTQGLQQVA
ncbi:MAG TPA: FAD:protein FMN transferase [Bryobacteraceae bacterium]